MKRAGFRYGLLLLFCLLFSSAGAAQPPPSMTVTVEPMTSNTGVPPSISGNNAVYSYASIVAGSSVVDSILVRLCATSVSAAGISATFDFQPAGGSGSLPGVTVMGMPVTFTAVGCQDVTLSIATGPLDEGNYARNLNIQRTARSPSNLNTTIEQPNNIQINVSVLPPPAISCFVTDGDFNFLRDCAGNEVTEGVEGRFAIVVNARRNLQVATNPGQFYAHVLWMNVGADERVVDVEFERYGVVPKGAQAIHARVFPPPFSGVTMEDFELVNESMPGGSDDHIGGIAVPGGWTLWVTYHVEWGGRKMPVPTDCAESCAEANQLFSVQATVSGDGVAPVSCETGARGYKKK
jgi:hypothetical protein